MLESRSSTIKIVGAALLAPFAVLFQNLPPIFLTPWFMRIDLVAIPWIICWSVFGLKTALLCFIISVPLVGFLGPFAGGVVGIVMKSVASIWMFLIPAVFAHKVGGIQNLLRNKLLFTSAAIVALTTRAVVTVLFNFYFALPVFFGMTPDDIFLFFEQLGVFTHSYGLIGLGAYIAEIAIWNTVQGSIDLLVSFAIGNIILRRFLKGRGESQFK